MKFVLLGDPVSSSKSPRMHAAAYRAAGLPHAYEGVRVDVDDLEAWIEKLRRGEVGGINVTVPHKAAVLAHADEIDESARVVSAANTLVRTPSGKVRAYNTDVPALAEEIRALAPEIGSDAWAGATGIVIGSGGAARAAIAALGSELGAGTIVVRARAFSNDANCTQFARTISEALGRATSWLLPLDAPHHPAEDAALAVLQATSAGMTGKDSGDAVARAVAFAKLQKSAIAIDAIYAPPETPFLRAARAHGLRAANGLGMLARQGARAYSLWLETTPPYEAMRAALA